MVKMNTTQIVLLVAAIILFFIGAWPISFALLIAFFIVTANKKKKETNSQIDELKKRIEELEKGR